MNSQLTVVHRFARPFEVTKPAVKEPPRPSPAVERPVGSVTITVDGQQVPLLAMKGDFEWKWMAVDGAPKVGLVVGGARNGLTMGKVAYRVMEWGDKAMVQERGGDLARWVRVKFMRLGRLFQAC